MMLLWVVGGTAATVSSVVIITYLYISISIFFIDRLLREDTCDDIFDDLGVIIKKSNLCARSQEGDSCKGDSGGGLLVQERG